MLGVQTDMVYGAKFMVSRGVRLIGATVSIMRGHIRVVPRFQSRSCMLWVPVWCTVHNGYGSSFCGFTFV